MSATLAVLIALSGATQIDPEVDALSRAMSALQKRQLTVALAAIEEPASSTDVLFDYRAWIRARILYALSRPDEAREALAVIPPCNPPCRHPLTVDVAELRARTYETRSPLKAADLYAALAPDGRLYARGIELYRSRGDEKRAVKLEERLLVDAAHSPEAKELASALGAKIGETIPSVERRKTRVMNLLDAHDNEESRADAEALLAELPPKHPLACELHFAIAKAARKLHDYKASVESTMRARKECARLAREEVPPNPKKIATSSTTWANARAGANEMVLRAALLETEVRAIRHDYRGARNVALSIPATHTFADDALFLLAEVLGTQGEAQESRAMYEKVLAEHAGEDLASEATWRLALSAINDGDDARAKELLAQMNDARGRYWLARLSEGTDAACARYEAATSGPALSFYAWLALDRVARTLPACSSELRAKLALLHTAPARTSSAASAPVSYEGTVQFARAKKLVLIPGFKVYASLEIGRLRREGMSEEEMIALALAYDAIGDHRRAQLSLRTRTVAARLGALPDARALQIWRAAYSRPFEVEIERAAKEQKIDPLLLYALAREESTFDPEIISWAGAVGLAQLMPKTAQSVHAQLGLGRLNPAKLTDPALNLRLGARVLRDGLRRFASSVPLALAAYNGGPGAVTRNMPPREQELDLWIESIPVKETRQYVKRVIQTYGIYHFLYDTETPFIDLPDAVGSSRRR